MPNSRRRKKTKIILKTQIQVKQKQCHLFKVIWQIKHIMLYEREKIFMFKIC